jgi:YjbE family integral membrane protein
MEFLGLHFGSGQLGALLQVVLIDLVMSGDNAIIIGMAVAGLPPENRTKIIFWGVAGATILRIGFAAITTQLLQIIGLTLAGGLLLAWVAWRMYRELRLKSTHHTSEVDRAAQAAPKSMRQAMIQIIAADVSMSLDNVLAVAGAARDHKVVLWIGLALSIVLMAIASNAIAKVLDRYHWIAWIGFAIILYVAGDMIWDGTHEVVAATGKA